MILDDRRTIRVANELHHAFPQFTLPQICEVVDREITADAAAIKLLEMDAVRNKDTEPSTTSAAAQPPTEMNKKEEKKEEAVRKPDGRFYLHLNFGGRGRVQVAVSLAWLGLFMTADLDIEETLFSQ